MFKVTVSCNLVFNVTVSCNLVFKVTVSCNLVFKVTVSCNLVFNVTVSCNLVFSVTEFITGAQRQKGRFGKVCRKRKSFSFSLLILIFKIKLHLSIYPTLSFVNTIISTCRHYVTHKPCRVFLTISISDNHA